MIKKLHLQHEVPVQYFIVKLNCFYIIQTFFSPQNQRKEETVKTMNVEVFTPKTDLSIF